MKRLFIAIPYYIATLTKEPEMKFITTTIMLLIFSPSVFAAGSLGSKEVLLDNEVVEVVRLTYPAGSESGMHTHKYPSRVAYFVKGGKLELIPGDPGKPADVLNVADGQTLYLPGGTHNVRNIGDTEVVIIETEIK
jgi:mannose-6-phosphate isomerase-like protein (cupin superfamily)